MGRGTTVTAPQTSAPVLCSRPRPRSASWNLSLPPLASGKCLQTRKTVARRSSLFEDYSLVASKKESRLLRDHSHVLSLAPRRQPERPGRVTGSPVPRPRWMPAWSGTRRTAILSLGRRHRAPVSADGLPGPRTAPGRGHGPDAAHTVSTGHWANPAEGRSAGWARRP